MKILYHHRIRSKDGQYVHIEEIVRALHELGHEVILVGPTALEKEEFGADAGTVNLLKRLLPRPIYELLEFAYSLRAYLRLWRAARRHHPDCLYERYNLYLPSGVWLKRRFKLPMLLEVNAPLFDERKEHGNLSLAWLARWSENYTWRGADFVLAVTHVLAEQIRQAGIPESKIVVIPNGVSLSRFAKAASRSQAKHRLGLERHLVLGFTGFVREWHGLEGVIDLIATCKQTSPLHLLLVGDGPARITLEKQARDQGIRDNLTITGVVPRDAVVDYLAAFDVALQPAVVAYASPLKLFEYMAAGCAILAPAMPNIQEILTDGENALLFRPRDPVSFATALERLCSDSALRDRLGRAATGTIFEKGFTWENNAKRIAELFDRLSVGNTPQFTHAATELSR